MKTLFVNLGQKQIGTLKSKGDTFAFKPTSTGVGIGAIPSPSTVRDLVAAGVYLCREAAAISCTVSFYTVSK